MFLLAPVYPGSHGPKAVKELCVSVCVCVCVFFQPIYLLHKTEIGFTVYPKLDSVRSRWP